MSPEFREFVRSLIPDKGMRRGYSCNYLEGDNKIVVALQHTPSGGDCWPTQKVSISVNNRGDITLVDFTHPTQNNKLGQKLNLRDPNLIEKIWSTIQCFYQHPQHPQTSCV